MFRRAEANAHGKREASWPEGGYLRLTSPLLAAQRVADRYVAKEDVAEEAQVAEEVMGVKATRGPECHMPQAGVVSMNLILNS